MIEALKKYFRPEVNSIGVRGYIQSNKVLSNLEINDRQHVHIIRAFALEQFCVTGPHNYELIKSLPHIKINSTKLQKLINKTSHRSVRNLIYIYYNSNKNLQCWEFYRNFYQLSMYKANYIERLAALLQDALDQGILDNKYRTSNVMNLIKVLRKTEDWSMMPILADALQDADYPDEQVLSHYRNDKHFSLGSWIFKAAGMQ